MIKSIYRYLLIPTALCLVACNPPKIAVVGAASQNSLSSQSSPTPTASVSAAAFSVTNPVAGSTLSGTAYFTGTAGSQWVNVAAYDPNVGWSQKLGADATPTTGGYSIAVDTTKLPNGPATIGIVAFSVPAGQNGGTSSEIDVVVNIMNANSTPPPTPTPSGNGSSLSVGFYATDSELSRMEGILGHKVAAIGYVMRDSWGDYVSPDFGLTNNVANGRKTAISLPTILDSGTDMPSAASGAYDQYYAQLGQNLAPYCSQIISFAINWEFNGSWMAWGVTNSDGSLRWQPSDMIAAHQRLANILRQYCPNVPIVWGVNNGPESNLPAGYASEQFYPGDAYVDAVGLDMYEQNWAGFAGALTDGGLNWLDSFASAHNKMIAFPEWQATNDDASFITSMGAWMNDPSRKSRMLQFSYWDSDDAVNIGGALYEEPALQNAFVQSFP
jgi:hypothetical protein